MTPTERGAIYDEMNRVIAALHTVKFADRGLANYGKPGNYFDRQIGRWSKQYVASITQPIEEMDRLMEWLPRTCLPAPGMSPSLHRAWRLPAGQPHVPPTEPRVIAVLDWELSTLGHPLADFSYHCMSWHIPAALGRGIAGQDLAGTGHSGRRQLHPQLLRAHWHCRPKHCGPTGTSTWPATCSASRHLAGHCQAGGGRHRLQRRSQTSGETARPMAQLAWSFAQRG